MSPRERMAAFVHDWRFWVAVVGALGAVGYISPVERLGRVESHDIVQDTALARHVREESARHDSLTRGLDALRLGACVKESSPLPRAYLRCPPEVRPSR